MAENLTLARPYAEAAFQLARAGNALGPWSEALGRMAAVADNGTMRDCIGNPNLAADQLVKLFVDVVGGALTAEQQNFVRVLVDNERLQVLPEIRDLFEQLRHAFEGVKDAEITSAFPLDDAAFARLIADLEQKFGKLQASVVVDPALIGGVKIAIGDRVIDASVRGKLAAMATALQN
jgi:F-type H+-transporting ATPase subunit delta